MLMHLCKIIHYCERKHFCFYCLQAFSTSTILKCHVKDCFKVNGKQMINFLKKAEYVRFMNYERKLLCRILKSLI